VVAPAPVVPGPLVGAETSEGDIPVVSVELGTDVVEVESLEVELVEDSVVVGGGSVVVGGSVLVVGGRGFALVVGGASVVEVVARLVRVTITGVCERVVVVGSVEVAGRTCWRCGSVVVVWVVAWAACRGEVATATMLPPIAPISIAVTTLTHRRAATKATGLKRRTPPGSRLLVPDDRRQPLTLPGAPRSRRARHGLCPGGHHEGATQHAKEAVP
jgi:hypothetical protein